MAASTHVSRRWMRYAAALAAALAAAIFALVGASHIETVLELRRYGEAAEYWGAWPLLLPLVGIAASAALLWKARPGPALAFALPSLLLVTFFWIVQGASRAG